MTKVTNVRQSLHRLPRESYKGQVAVSITACLEGRTEAFADVDVVSEFIRILVEVAARRDCTVPVYCFMPDHVHMVFQGERPNSDVWAAIVEFKQRSGYWLRVNRPRVTWQRNFYDHVLRNGEDVSAHVRYILDNPCRKGLVTSWDEYPHSGVIGCTREDVLMGIRL